MTTLLAALHRAGSGGLRLVGESGTTFVPWTALAERGRRLASGLRRAGVRDGDPVALTAEDPRTFLESWWGVVQAGAAPTPGPPGGPVARWCLADRGARTASAAVLAVEELDGPPLALLPRRDTPVAWEGRDRATPITADALAAHLAAFAGPGGAHLGPGDVVSVPGPVGPEPERLVPALAAWWCGADLVVPVRPLGAEGWVRVSSEHRVTAVFASGAWFARLAGELGGRALAGLDLRRWRIAGVVGGPVDPEVLQRLAWRLAPSGFSERAWWTCYRPDGHPWPVAAPPVGRGLRLERGAPSCGPLLPGQRVAVVDAAGRRVPDGVVGELWLGSGDREPVDRTGDLGFFVDGELYLAGRVAAPLGL